MMKKQYQAPRIHVIQAESCDVLTLSNLTISPMGGGEFVSWNEIIDI